MKIVIDIGHAYGTGSRGNGLEEHNVATKIGKHLNTLLRDAGNDVDVIDFPEMSNTGDLNASVRAVNAGGYDIAISLHCDSSDNKQARGGHVIYFPTSTKGKRLAESIANQLIELLPGRANKIVPKRNFAILRQTRPVAVICECGFITNAHDSNIMKNSPELIAERIAQGVKNYQAS